MNQKYLIRLDDACPTMDSVKWGRMEGLLCRYNIVPMVGVIPHNEDTLQKREPEDKEFWNKVICWQQKGWSIALHGYNHCYSSNDGMKGLNPMWNRSEFAGLSIEEQCTKIREGVAILREHGINPEYFFAPSHTFDKNTLVALRQESDIRIISDTIGLYPYQFREFWFIPQITGHCVKMPINGIYTFCFHPNTMNDAAFEKLENFIVKNKSQFIGFKEIDVSKYGNKRLIDRFISWAFFNYRRLKGFH